MGMTRSKELLLGGPGLGLPEPDHEVPRVLALLHPHAAQQARHLLGHPADQRLVTLAATFIKLAPCFYGPKNIVFNQQ